MKFNKGFIWVGFACVLLGIFLALQYKYYSTNYLSDPTQYEKMTAELNKLRAEKQALQIELEELEKKLDNITNSTSQESVYIENLKEDIQRYKAFLGLTKLSGTGIVITLDEPLSDGGLAYDYRLILELINELRASGAEAISVNEQRITNYSEIRLVGRQLNINYVPITVPYVIKVIGNYDTLNGAITQRFGVIPKFRSEGYYAEVRAAEEMEIPAYNGVFKFIYSSVIK
ncbi:MAG: DUF881 domain-containing protein [Bacillota bacterium]|nr:DUF881 domain-containing protein [Bacillota bacterium]